MDKPYLQERKYKLQQELRAFENTYPMTLGERKEVHKWVLDGNSINTNPWFYYYDNGYEMNYLDAMRFEEVLCKEMVTKTQPSR